MKIDVEKHEEDHTYRIIFPDKHSMDLILSGIILYQSAWQEKAADSDNPAVFYSICRRLGNMIAEMHLDAQERDDGTVACRFSDLEMAGILKTMLQ